MKTLFAICLAAMLACIAAFVAFTPTVKVPAGEHEASKPILRMELVNDVAHAAFLDGQGQERMAISQYIDLAFIPTYALLLALCARLNFGGSRWWRVAVWAAIGCIAAAAVADIFEDARILHLLGQDWLQVLVPRLPNDNGFPRYWALPKWRLFAACILIEGVLIGFRERPTAVRLWLGGLAGAFAMAAGGLCIWSASLPDGRAIQRSTSLAGAALVGIVAWTIYERWGMRISAKIRAAVQGKAPPVKAALRRMRTI